MGEAHLRSVLTMLATRQFAWELTAAQKRNSFGSCQERKLFPFFYAPDRLGNENVPIRGEPHCGPGTYNYGEKNTILYTLAHRPASTKGYTMGARTAPRFGVINKHITPGPTAYQSVWIKDRKEKFPNAPFWSRSPQYSVVLQEREYYPGPGTYDPYNMPHRHVTWPGMFGPPDWSLVPLPPRRALRTELLSDREFRKHRNLLAYLSLYYKD